MTISAAVGDPTVTVASGVRAIISAAAGVPMETVVSEEAVTILEAAGGRTGTAVFAEPAIISEADGDQMVAAIFEAPETVWGGLSVSGRSSLFHCHFLIPHGGQQARLSIASTQRRRWGSKVHLSPRSETPAKRVDLDQQIVAPARRMSEVGQHRMFLRAATRHRSPASEVTFGCSQPRISADAAQNLGAATRAASPRWSGSGGGDDAASDSGLHNKNEQARTRALLAAR